MNKILMSCLIIGVAVFGLQVMAHAPVASAAGHVILAQTNTNATTNANTSTNTNTTTNPSNTTNSTSTSTTTERTSDTTVVDHATNNDWWPWALVFLVLLVIIVIVVVSRGNDHTDIHHDIHTNI